MANVFLVPGDEPSETESVLQKPQLVVMTARFLSAKVTSH